MTKLKRINEEQQIIDYNIFKLTKMNKKWAFAGFMGGVLMLLSILIYISNSPVFIFSLSIGIAFFHVGIFLWQQTKIEILLLRLLRDKK